MKAKTTRKKLIKRLDDTFSKWIRARDGKCVTCGSRENLQCGHLFTRQSYSTRWNPLNAAATCASCNYYHEFNPHTYTNWFIDKYGLKKYKELNREFHKVKKWTDKELEDLITKYK